MKKVKANREVELKVERIIEFNRKLAALKIEKDILTEEIKDYMDEAEADTLQDRKGEVVIGMIQTRGGALKFDVKKFETERPEEYKKYLSETKTYRVFLIK